MTTIDDLLQAVRQPWMRQARCRGMDPLMFMPGRGDDARTACAFCAGCSVRQECLEYGLSMPGEPGVYGGTTARERIRIRAERRSLVTA